MGAKAAERETAIAAADETCPRCGARRQRDQRYCLDCGLPLPAVTGRLASLRRRWIRRFGWYPGDWVWVSLLTLVVAVAGAAAAIALTASTASANGPTFVATSPVSVAQPSPVPTSTTPVNTSKLPTAPRADHSDARAGKPPERPLRLADERERLDDRARLLPEDERRRIGPRQGRPGRARPASRGPGCSTRRSTRACSPGISWSSRASTARKPMRTRPSRPPGRRASAAPTPARSRAERGKPAGVGAAEAGRMPWATCAGVYSIENICNSPWQRVESTPGRVGRGGFTAS